MMPMTDRPFWRKLTALNEWHTQVSQPLYDVSSSCK